MYGYAGRIALVDVTTGAVRDVKLADAERRQFVGGRGVASRLLMDLVPRGADPLGPENAVIFAAGPLNGTLIPASSRVERRHQVAADRLHRLGERRGALGPRAQMGRVRRSGRHGRVGEAVLPLLARRTG